MNNGNVAIFGMGWLGKPLALSLKKNGNKVFAATRNIDKVKEFNKLGLVGFQVSFETDSVKIYLSKEELDQMDYLIICIPPSGFSNYAESLGSIVSYFNSETKIIFTSSTGVYEEVFGAVTEASYKIHDHPVHLAERKLEEIASNRLTILRLAGLIGENRHPVKYFIQKNLIPNSSAPVNLVCLKDVIRSIELILEKQLFRKTYNIVNPSHPSKEEYYLSAAKELYNSKPNTESGSGGKLVLGTKFEEEISFAYNFPIDDWDEFRNTKEYS
ncbi:MAG: NAD(P)-binding domain-containing protein [Bacteroidetes bacterium]|nr:NAD(P)-binding domain-containing protein [Bacteroidota bacterium]